MIKVNLLEERPNNSILRSSVIVLGSNDEFTTDVISGTIFFIHCLGNQVGIGSNSQLVDLDFIIISLTALSSSGLNSLKEGQSISGFASKDTLFSDVGGSFALNFSIF